MDELAIVSVPPGLDIIAAASKENGRYYTDNIRISMKDGNAISMATDGRCASITTLGVMTGANWDGIIPATVAPKKGDKGNTRNLVLNGKVERVAKDGTMQSAALAEGPFPPIAAVMPNVEDYDVRRINLALLTKVANAISDDGILTVFIPKKNTAWGVMGNHGVGVVCPIQGYDDDEKRAAFNASAARIPQ